MTSGIFRLTNTTQQWWGLEKFRLHDFAREYERAFYIDADVILRDSVPNLFEFVARGYVAMHDDWPHLPGYDWLWNERGAILSSQGVPMDWSETAWNRGVVLCDRDQADVWQPPLAPFLPSHCAEQFWIESNALLDAEIPGAIDISEDRSLGKLPELQESRTS